jgi:hypothetical protein
MKGHRVSLATRAREAGLHYSVVYSRVHCLGWSLERALSTPEKDHAAADDQNAKARAETIRRMAERETTAAEYAIEAREAAKCEAAAAAERTRIAETYREVIQRDASLYSPRHVTAHVAPALPPRHQAPVEAALSDDFIARHVDALAVADAETYDAAFDPDFFFTPNPYRKFWNELKRDRAAS